MLWGRVKNIWSKSYNFFKINETWILVKFLIKKKFLCQVWGGIWHWWKIKNKARRESREEGARCHLSGCLNTVCSPKKRRQGLEQLAFVPSPLVLRDMVLLTFAWECSFSSMGMNPTRSDYSLSHHWLMLFSAKIQLKLKSYGKGNGRVTITHF